MKKNETLTKMTAMFLGWFSTNVNFRFSDRGKIHDGENLETNLTVIKKKVLTDPIYLTTSHFPENYTRGK